jgi:hypothetical protein
MHSKDYREGWKLSVTFEPGSYILYYGSEKHIIEIPFYILWIISYAFLSLRTVIFLSEKERAIDQMAVILIINYNNYTNLLFPSSK